MKKILDGRLRGLRQEVTDLRQREKLRQVQIQYYLDRLPEQEKQVRMVHPEFRLQKEMEKNALCDAGVLRNWEGFGRPMRWCIGGS